MRWLKVGVSADVPIGPFLDSTDGVTPKTALTITQPDIRLKKNAANWAQKAAVQTLLHEENGFYEVTLDATDTNTLGLMRLAVVKATAAPVWEDFLVVPANVYDSLVSGTDWLPVTSLLADFVISGATLTVRKQDGATAQFTKIITTAAGNPITGLD